MPPNGVHAANAAIVSSSDMIVTFSSKAPLSSFEISQRKARSPSSALSHPFFGEGFPTKIDYRRKNTSRTLILTSLLVELELGQTTYHLVQDLVHP